jgi:hypothetical protein
MNNVPEGDTRSAAMKPEYLLAALVAVAVGGIAVVTSLDRHFTATPPRCEGQSFDLVTAPGGRSPYIRLAVVDGRTGPFLLDYGATSSLSRDVFRDVFQAEPAGGGKVVINKFSLPSFPTGQFNQAKYAIDSAPPGGQLDVIGSPMR